MSATNDVAFTFSDLIMGYVGEYDPQRDALTLDTSDGRRFEVHLGPLTCAETLRNLGEAYHDATAVMRERFDPGRLVFVYGTFLPQPQGTRFEAKRVVFLGEHTDEFRFEERTWWVEQIRALADFYLNAEFGGHIDWSEYRTQLTADGSKDLRTSHRQECDTISRLVYGFASAFLLSGDERYCEAAEKGTEYLREHFRFTDSSGISYWYHAIDLDGPRERKIFASEFNDDYDAIPLYEQIYALAGPVQTYRATGDARVLTDVETTVAFFDRHFRDRERGGYFSHVDPVAFDPRAEGLGQDRARKNWNSVGDHAPAFLINVVAATGAERRWLDMLEDTADTITRHFPDYDDSPFVNERFLEDWSKDQSWGWQQNRAVVGHNLKIAWNLMRVRSVLPKNEYLDFARRIAEVMPEAGSDTQRGGWYDVVERTKAPGERFHSFAWHDRKAWWQQEQAILAYLILAGCLGEPDHLRRARESAAFYNAFFLDHDAGGVYFNVLANGVPYLMGTERLKGSHSMAGYHSFELCYLAATYTNLLVTRQPLDLYFRPRVKDLPAGVLRVAPDLLPAGSVVIGHVWVDGATHSDFDAETMEIRLPSSVERPLVRVELRPVTMDDRADVALSLTQDDAGHEQAVLRLAGTVDSRAVAALRGAFERIGQARPATVVVDVGDVEALTAEGVRALAFFAQKLDLDCEMTLRGASGEVAGALRSAELSEIFDIDTPAATAEAR
jgi:mannose/cellobiose epimerase-like protein (N-acyl-D-glucosamine 2-epimerase family)/anti-anti-sigma regulatory factor